MSPREQIPDIYTKTKPSVKDKWKDLNVDEFDINKVSANSASNISNNSSTLDLFPDIELSINIITSSIISSKDLLKGTLNYNLTHPGLPSLVIKNILDKISDHIKSKYDIESKLEDIVREAMFEKGSYVWGIIPISSISPVGGTEIALEEAVDNHMKKPNLILGNVGPRDSEIDKMLTFTDDTSLLALNYKYANVKQKDMLDIMMATEDGVTAFEIEDIERDTDTPLSVKIPAHSVVPIFSPGDEKQHVGYFVLLDQNGAFIAENSDNVTDTEIYNIYSSSILKRASVQLGEKTRDAPTVHNMNEIYESVVTSRLLKVLEISPHLKSISELGKTEDVRYVYKMLMSRILKKKKTRVLFLPAGMVEYYAFSYRRNGTGESLLEKVSVLSSIRAMLLFSRLMGTVKNAVPTTKVAIKLDENDPDPAKSKERIITNLLKTKQLDLPVGLSGVNDMVQWIHKMGYYYEVEHDKLPNIKIDQTNTNSQVTLPSLDLDEDIRNRILMGIGMVPELVEQGAKSDFAADIISNNALLVRRIQKSQYKLQEHLTSQVRKLIYLDGGLREVINKAFNDTYQDTDNPISKSKVLSIFLKKLSISLPGIEIDSEDGLPEEFAAYKSNLEEAMLSVFSEEVLSANPEVLKKRDVIYHTLLRKWMVSNNYFDELTSLVEIDDGGESGMSTLNEGVEYSEQLLGILSKLNK